MDREDETLLERLLMAHGPGGQEDEVRISAGLNLSVTAMK